VIANHYRRHTSAEFFKFLKNIDGAVSKDLNRKGSATTTAA
jgi:hypothetical protein